jgi:hypothetical protein
MLGIIKILAFLLVLSNFAVADSLDLKNVTDKVVLTCNQLDQGDILLIKVIQKENQDSIVLTQKDGEVEFFTKIPSDLNQFSCSLPFWKGFVRTLRKSGHHWIISSCGGTNCIATRVNCF